MLIASMIVKVVAPEAQAVQKRLESIPKVKTYGIHREDNIIVVTEARSVEELEQLSKHITHEIPGVLGVFPTYVTEDEEE
ncbi:chaperone NapD [candidate division KSB1 bacterium]|nr:chaperone NapD [candidate division KSB1 bacterium]